MLRTIANGIGSVVQGSYTLVRGKLTRYAFYFGSVFFFWMWRILELPDLRPGDKDQPQGAIPDRFRGMLLILFYQ